MTALSYFIAVSDGLTLRTLHPPALGEQRARIEAAIRAVLAEGVQVSRTSPPPPASDVLVPRYAARPADPHTSTQGEIARASGFSGMACGECGSFAMVRTGTCETCQECGKTSGGCS